MARALHGAAGVRLSAFNLYLDDQPEPGRTLVYNTFTGAFVVLAPDELRALRKLDHGERLDEQERAAIEASVPELLDGDVGVLVDSREAEEREFHAWYERMRSQNDALEVIVGTTFACNLDCTYCCQSDVLDGKVMSVEIADRTASWLARRAREIDTRRVRITFVGGEPLLQPQRIEQIVARVRAEAAPGTQVVFDLITNGVFLTPALVDRWVPLGLKGAQVTLDGDETTHSITRRSKKRDEDSFPVVFANVAAAAQRIEIRINGNYQPDTAHGFVPLIEKLRAAGLPDGSRVRFTPALSTLGAPSDAAAGACTWGEASPELMVVFGDAIRRAGYDPDFHLEVGPCGFHMLHHFGVDPDGHIYKCPGFLGHPEWAVGHVATGLTSRYDGLANLRPHRECGGCAHRPACAGGCVANAYLKAGRAEGVNCEIGYFESQKTDVLVRKYLLETCDDRDEALRRFPAPKAQVPSPPTRPGVRPAALRVLAAA